MTPHRAESREGKVTMTNEELELSVTDELFWDPKVDSEAIAVSADGGTVTLRGTVGSFREKREARKAAERGYGVVFVNNDLDVRILTEQRRVDADLRGDVLQALTLDAAVPSTVDATVKDGLVTLTGIAVWQYQRDEAEFVAGNILGVTGVQNQIYLDNPPPTPATSSTPSRRRWSATPSSTPTPSAWRARTAPCG